ncbi:hypothetical protein RCZ15_23350 [Capnocytophaga catalasegens]|uniref:Gp5/Type VI secretion system Vgr protein OB-fold domain-containing protein n=2 Tax=Capnocytophaga catalasegens TaxID=1004260 RepID=A0AAV5B054_9FLAO|nr:hypothetical protein RCZ15_23350 [Capnocytophaga catalasegens]
MIDGKDFLGNAHFETYLTQRTNDHDEFTIVVRENAIDSIKRPVMEKSGDLLGESIVIKFHQYGKVVQTYKGVITKIENYKEEGGGYGELRISGKSPSILLENGKDCQTYIEKDLTEIIKNATEEYPNFAKVHIEGGLNNSSRIPYTVQYNESDYQFIQRLAKRYGEFFYYNGLQLIFGNKAQETILLTHGAELIDVSFEVELQPQNFRYVGYDTHYNNTDQKEAKDIITQDKINPVIWDAIKGANKIYTKVPEKLVSNIPTEYASGYLNRAVKLEKEKREQMMVVKGKSRNPQMRVGVFAKLRSIYDLPMETFRVIEIKHYQEGYEYYNEFTAIPDAFIPYYYDEDSYPKALQQPARVIDNNDPEGLGRVQVQFVWQERKKEHTPWIRVVQPHAGAGKGFYFIPEIGEEVLVDFEFQNAERPYVVGAHYNGEEMSRYHTQGNDKKVIHTRSGTKIVLNDGEGSVFIEDPSGNNIYMDGKQKISFNGATLEFNAQRIIMNATERTEITTNDYILNALSKIYVFSSWFKQQINGFMHLFSNSALINSPNTIDIEAKEAKLQGTEKSIVDSKKQAIVNSLGTAELKGKEGNKYNQNADNVSSSPDEEIGLAVVHFRPLDSWKGEFGFDWLRVDDGNLLPNDSVYETIIDGGYGNGVVDLTGYDPRGVVISTAYETLKTQYYHNCIRRKNTANTNIEYFVPYLSLFSKEFVDKLVASPNRPAVLPQYEAEIQLLIEIEEDIEKLEFDYEKEFFKLDKDILSHKTRTSLTKGETIKITCLKDLDRDKEIKIYAYPKINTEPELILGSEIQAVEEQATFNELESLLKRKLAGKIIVLQNNHEVRQEEKFVLIPVATDVTGSDYRMGSFTIPEKNNFYNSFYQALIIPIVEVSPNKLDLSNKSDFQVKIIDGVLKEGKFILGGTNRLNERWATYERDKITNTFNRVLQKLFLEDKDRKGNFKNLKYASNYFMIFSLLADVHSDKAYGQTDADYIRQNNRWFLTNFRKNVCLFKNRDAVTLNHESYHGFGVFHIHREIDEYGNILEPIILYDKKKYIYNYRLTTNIMAYNSFAYTSWRWQWNIINSKVNEK